MTIGVRAMVIDGAGRILLVRHAYAPGWLFPGGGVEPGETVLVALSRELEEEAAIVIGETPEVFGVYSNEHRFRGDHVVFYVIRRFVQGNFVPNMEIREAQFFNRQALPADTTSGTLRRIEEVLDGRTQDDKW